MTNRVSRREFRQMLSPGAALLLPGVSNALAARVVGDQGFAAAYVTGAGIANSYLGVPDNGLVTLSESAVSSESVLPESPAFFTASSDRAT